MEKILTKLKETAGVLGVYLTDEEGSLLFVSSSLDNSPLPLAGLFASLKGYFSELSEQTKVGKFIDAIINSSAGRIIISSIAEGKILVVFTSNISSLGTIRLSIANTIEALKKES